MIEISELDVIYLSYKEPKKEEFWAQISAEIPWAKRVDGVDGIDAAHKAAAAASDTERFILIDGDNLPDWNFFNQTLDLPSVDDELPVLRWRARNVINGLSYGNGGLSCWTRAFVNNMRSHENSDGDPANDVEFCFMPGYWAMAGVWSTTYPNGSAQQAWQAGYREGVKMCLNRGVPLTLSTFKNMHPQNRRVLETWHNIGDDVENGKWAILGARQGTAAVMLDDEDYHDVADFSALNRLWHKTGATVALIDVECKAIGRRLESRLGLPELELDGATSAFFKSLMPTPKPVGVNQRE